MVGGEGEDATGEVFGDGTGSTGGGVRGKVGKKGIEVTAREDVALIAKAVVDAFAGGEVGEEDRDVGAVEGMREEANGGMTVEGGGVCVVDFAATGEERGHSFEAQETHERLELVHLGVGANGRAFGFTVDGEVAEFEETFLKRGIAEDKQSPFCRMEKLGRVEGEHGDIARGREGRDAESMGGVVDDFDAVLVGEALEAGDIAGIAVDVDGNDGTGARSDGAFGGFRRKAKRVGIDVGEDGRGSGTDDGVGGGNERERSGDDFTRGNAKRGKSEFQG